MRWMKYVAKRLLVAVALFLFAASAAVMAMTCDDPRVFFLAAKVARWFGPGGVGVVMLVSCIVAQLEISDKDRTRPPVGVSGWVILDDEGKVVESGLDPDHLEPTRAPLVIRQPGSIIQGADIAAVSPEDRIPFDPAFDDGPTVISNPVPAPRPRRETQRLVTLAHARALGLKDPE